MKHSTGVCNEAVFRAMRGLGGALGVLVSAAAISAPVAAQEHVVVNFDDPKLEAGVHAGNIFLEQGVRITSCVAPGALKAGGSITLTELQPWIELWRYGWAVSAPNYVVALDAGTHDMLLSFSVPITNVEMDLDFYPYEAADKDRVAILEQVSGNTFKVLKYVEFTDENAVPPPTHVSIDLDGTPFTHVLFQVLNELEGFDNLEFNTTGPIPPPSGEGPPGPPPPGSGGWEGGGGGSGGGAVDPPSTGGNSNVNGSGGTPDPTTTGNENKAPGSPSTDGEPAPIDNPGDGAAGVTNTNSSPGGENAPTQQDYNGAGGGSCGAPVAIIMLSGMFLLRLLAHREGITRRKS